MTQYYRDRTSGKNITLDAAKAAHPNISFGTNLTEHDYDKLNIDYVFDSPLPHATSVQHVEEVDPVKKGDKWYRTFRVVNSSDGMTADQLATFKANAAALQLKHINAKRDAILNNGFKYDFSTMKLESGGLASGTFTIQTRNTNDLNNLNHLESISKNMAMAGKKEDAISLRVAENVNVLVTASKYLGIYHNLITYRSNVTKLAAQLKDQISAAAVDVKKSPNDIVAIVMPDNPTF